MSSHDEAQGESELDLLAAAMEHELFVRPALEKVNELQRLEVLMETELFVYSYHPCPPGAAVIRLLCLHPGIRSEPLTATLQFAPLTGSICYEALSYAWGNGKKTRKIYLDGRLLLITKSLYVALDRLRLRDKSRVLWVDAICINQQHNEEKSSQVALMGDIYSNASCVLCWLGLDTPHKDGVNAFNILTKLNSADPLTDLNTIRQWVVTQGLPPYGDKRWRSLAFFFTVPWLQRRWVIQEFVKGTEVKLICGDYETDWTELLYGVQRCAYSNLLWWAFEGNLTQAKEHIIAQRGLKAFCILLELKIQCGPFSRAWKYMEGVSEAKTITYVAESHFDADVARWIRLSLLGLNNICSQSAICSERQARTGVLKDTVLDRDLPAKLSLSSLLAQCQFSAASDPRDYIYALLSLAEEGQNPALKPNYSESARSVYIRCARVLIEQRTPLTMMLLVLAGKASGYGRSTKIEVPSWVRDWSISGTMGSAQSLVLRGINTKQYRAAADTSISLHFDDSQADYLYLQGNFHSTITRILPSPLFDVNRDTNNPNLYFDAQRYFRDVDEIMLHRGRKYPYLKAPTSYIHHPDSSEHELEVLWRVLIGNSIDGLITPAEKTEAEYLAFRNWMGLPMMGPHQWQRFSHPVRNRFEPEQDDTTWGSVWADTMLHYCLAELTNGLFAMVPSQSRVGDKVFILLGFGAPFILHEIEDANTSAIFENVGAAYVHGIMEGEAVNASGWVVEEVCLA